MRSFTALSADSSSSSAAFAVFFSRCADTDRSCPSCTASTIDNRSTSGTTTVFVLCNPKTSFGFGLEHRAPCVAGCL